MSPWWPLNSRFIVSLSAVILQIISLVLPLYFVCSVFPQILRAVKSEDLGTKCLSCSLSDIDCHDLWYYPMYFDLTACIDQYQQSELIIKHVLRIKSLHLDNPFLYTCLIILNIARQVFWHTTDILSVIKTMSVTQRDRSRMISVLTFTYVISVTFNGERCELYYHLNKENLLQ